jgi:hypothetical protein
MLWPSKLMMTFTFRKVTTFRECSAMIADKPRQASYYHPARPSAPPLRASEISLVVADDDLEAIAEVRRQRRS